MKLVNDRPYADPDKAARRIMEIANTIEADQGKVHIEKDQLSDAVPGQGVAGRVLGRPAACDRQGLAVAA